MHCFDHWISLKEVQHPLSSRRRHESEMAEHSQRELYSGHVLDPVDKIRLQLLSQGFNGIIHFGRVFRRLDHEGERWLNFEKFSQGLKNSGLELTNEEQEAVFERFREDDYKVMSFSKLLDAIRPHFSEVRQHSLEMAYNKIDQNGDGQITIDNLKHVYNVKCHPSYMNGDETKEQILHRFMKVFEEKGKEGDIVITKEEFMDYYSAISASIDDDTFFDLVVRKAFNL